MPASIATSTDGVHAATSRRDAASGRPPRRQGAIRQRVSETAAISKDAPRPEPTTLSKCNQSSALLPGGMISPISRWYRLPAGVSRLPSRPSRVRSAGTGGGRGRIRRLEPAEGSKRLPLSRGTDSSNPLPSSGESITDSGQDYAPEEYGAEVRNLAEVAQPG